MKFSSVLFDLDGTLLKTADDLGAALNFVLRQYNKPTVSAALYTPEASNGSKGLLQLGFGQSFEQYDFEQLKSQFLSHYADNIACHTNYFDEVVKTLTYLNDNNVPWGIVTNKPEFLTTPLLTHFPLLENCHTVVSGDTVGVAKPNPKPMFHAFDEMKQRAGSDISPEHCLYVGDAQRDIEAGKNGGMKTVAALYGYIEPSDDVASWGADFEIETFGDLLRFF
jgi:2-phosphoglycolate phosphatase